MIKKIVLLPDIHYPNHNQQSMNAVFKFLDYFKPHVINLIGDAMEMNFASHWKRKTGDQSYTKDSAVETYSKFDNNILSIIEGLLDDDCEKVYMGGNHEHWVNGMIMKDPTLKGAIEPEILLGLEERGWDWIPYIKNHKRGIVKYGKLLVTHGFYTNKYHAAKMADIFSKSIVYGHTHDVQLYTKVTYDDDGYHTAQSIGCLCNNRPEFMRGNANRWVNAFAVIYLREDGMYNLYVPIIINGVFTFERKVFNGNV